VLSSLKAIADDALHSRAVTGGVTPLQAVLTHPAYFLHPQKNATLEAAELANIDVVELLIEPQAAAYAYGYHRVRQQNTSEREPYRLMVFDLGGGTFDATVVEVRPNGNMEEVSFDGDGALGDRDFDARLIEWCIQNVASLRGGCRSARIRARLAVECERTKIMLSRFREQR